MFAVEFAGNQDASKWGDSGSLPLSTILDEAKIWQFGARRLSYSTTLAFHVSIHMNIHDNHPAVPRVYSLADIGFLSQCLNLLKGGRMPSSLTVSEQQRHRTWPRFKAK